MGYISPTHHHSISQMIRAALMFLTKSTLLLLGYLLHEVVSDLLLTNINKFRLTILSFCPHVLNFLSPFTCPPVQQSL
jgi:hypothetical protein